MLYHQSQIKDADGRRDLGRLTKLHCRVVNFEPTTPLKLLKANYYGRTLTGTYISSLEVIIIIKERFLDRSATIQILSLAMAHLFC